MPVSSKRGFTLLELLVGLAIASLIIAAAYTVFFSFQRSQDIAVSEMEQRRMLRSTLDLMRRELSSLRFRKDDQLLRFLVEDRDFFGKPASTISFATIAPPLEGPVSDQLLVQYRTIEAPQGALNLIRASREHFQESATRTEYPLLEQQEGFLVECFDGSTWRKSWDTALTPSLPQAIRVTVSIRDGARIVRHMLVARPRITES